MEKIQSILALDTATKTGYAIYHNGKIIKHGTKEFRASTKESKPHKFFKWLESTITQYNVTTIVAEDIFRKHGNDYEQREYDNVVIGLGKLHGALECLCDEYPTITRKVVQPLHWKRDIIPVRGKRTREGDKARMLHRAKTLGYILETSGADDEADAIGIMLYYLESNHLPVTHPSKNNPQ